MAGRRQRSHNTKQRRRQWWRWFDKLVSYQLTDREVKAEDQEEEACRRERSPPESLERKSAVGCGCLLPGLQQPHCRYFHVRPDSISASISSTEMLSAWYPWWLTVQVTTAIKYLSDQPFHILPQAEDAEETCCLSQSQYHPHCPATSCTDLIYRTPGRETTVFKSDRGGNQDLPHSSWTPFIPGYHGSML